MVLAPEPDRLILHAETGSLKWPVSTAVFLLHRVHVDEILLFPKCGAFFARSCTFS